MRSTPKHCLSRTCTCTHAGMHSHTIWKSSTETTGKQKKRNNTNTHDLEVINGNKHVPNAQRPLAHIRMYRGCLGFICKYMTMHIRYLYIDIYTQLYIYSDTTKIARTYKHARAHTHTLTLHTHRMTEVRVSTAHQQTSECAGPWGTRDFTNNLPSVPN